MSSVQRKIYSVQEFDSHTNKWKSPLRYSANSNYRKRIWAERYIESQMLKDKRPVPAHITYIVPPSPRKFRIVEYDVVPNGNVTYFPPEVI
jgi:hypothetical protein